MGLLVNPWEDITENRKAAKTSRTARSEKAGWQTRNLTNIGSVVCNMRKAYIPLASQEPSPKMVLIEGQKCGRHDYSTIRIFLQLSGWDETSSSELSDENIGEKKASDIFLTLLRVQN